MGEDIHVVIEHMSDSGLWSCIMELHDMGRSYKIFNKIKNKGTPGFPVNVDHWTKHLLGEDNYGFGWMPMKDFCKIKHIERLIPTSIWLLPKKEYKTLRVVYSFDH